jgi:glutamate N-acetyltransferase / amino-acid N-acetyltransferase
MDRIALPRGFAAAGVTAGVKHPDAPKKDIALFVSDRPCSAAGVFTTNLVCGAPVKVSRERLPRRTARGLIINSGNANACTGEQGIADARQMTALVAERLTCAADDVLVASTGVIGRLLPMDRIARGIHRAAEALGSQPEQLLDAATAMMTTDTVPKLSTREWMWNGRSVRVTGVCKGAAMIAPNMATMLCAVMTDVRVDSDDAQRLLSAAVADSFNCISVDGHESTSDSVVLLANGASDASPETSADWELLSGAISGVTQDLARAIIQDAEGASHFVQIDVAGCRSRDDAFRLAQSIANSPLVKTAICGADPNWGRVISAAGYAGVPLRETDLSLRMNGFELYRAGTPLPFDAAAVSHSMRTQREVLIELHVTHGSSGIRFWTSDLTKDYVELNADYTT